MAQPASATSANDSGKVRELANSASATPKLVPPATSVRPLRIRREGLLHEHDDAGAVHSDGLHETEDHQNELPQRDRKSTRLNSSHTVISYAVFCLKKKQ